MRLHPDIPPLSTLLAAQKDAAEWRAIAERLDAKVLAEQRDHNLTVDRLIAAKERIATLEAALKDVILSPMAPFDSYQATLERAQRRAKEALGAQPILP